MPLNLSRGVTRSNLTPEQRRQAEAALIGVPLEKTMADGQLTHEEIERMRQILAQHDQQNQRGMKEFDLNNPPKLPYRHQEFPRLVYNHATGDHKRVHNYDGPGQLKESLAAGWSIEAVAPEVEEPELTAAELAEIATLDKEARKPKATK